MNTEPRNLTSEKCAKSHDLFKFPVAFYITVGVTQKLNPLVKGASTVKAILLCCQILKQCLSFFRQKWLLISTKTAR